MSEVITELLIDGITFLAILFPTLMVINILKREVGDLTKSLLWLLIGFLPIALFDLLEALSLMNIVHILPAEGTKFLSIIEHGVIVFAFLVFGKFLYIFKKKYVDPMYGEGNEYKLKPGEKPAEESK